MEFREWVFRDMVAESCEVDREVIDQVYSQKGSGIAEAIRICSNNDNLIFFYQDILEIEGRKYQVELAFDYNNILNFSCIEYRAEELRGTEKWEAGKEALTEMLSEYPDKVDEQFYYMEDLYYLAQSNGWMEYYDEFGQSDMAELSMIEEKGKEFTDGTDVEVSEFHEDYSYQVIELKDMILLLVQGDITIGLFYDPINEVFCGYNYFVE